MSLAQAVIAFFFEWASQERYKQLNGSILLLPGAISFLLATMGASEASVILEPLQVREARQQKGHADEVDDGAGTVLVKLGTIWLTMMG